MRLTLAVAIMAAIDVALLFFAAPILFDDAEAASPALILDPTRNTVSLVWDANTEPDMATYTVYAHYGDTLQVLGKVTQPVTGAIFTLSVRNYYERIGFTLTAEDRSGNESGHSDLIEAIFCRISGRLYADVNNDGMVDVEDLELIRASLGALPWYVMWVDEKDLNADRVIDVEDLEIARTRLGRR